MGQSPSSNMSRHDNASTRTLHSSSMHSAQPTSFFRRISNRLHVTHPTRRFNRQRHTPVRHQPSSITSSVRHATQEATRAAIAATGPPPQHYHPSSASSTFSTDPPQGSRNSFSQYLQLPLPIPPQRDINSTSSRPMNVLVIGYRIHSHQITPNVPTTTTSSSTSLSLPLPPSSSSLTTMPLSTASVDPLSDTNLTLPSLPVYRIVDGSRRRPRSVRSTSSSVDTIYSMPLSINSSTTHTRSLNQPQQQQEGQWIVYFVNPSHPNFQLLSSSARAEGNPSYEDLLWLSNIIGPARPLTTTQAAVDEAIPVTEWSDDTKRLVKEDVQCPVCLDEFVMAQPVRILKCCHVFHRECVDRWLCEAHNSCPVCRRVPV